jgi:hypothetical protein
VIKNPYLYIFSPRTGIGEQLESIHLERQRAQAAYDLFDLYGAFAREDTTRLDAMKKEGREGRRQVGIILRRLIIVAKEVNIPNADKVRLPLFNSIRSLTLQ